MVYFGSLFLQGVVRTLSTFIKCRFVSLLIAGAAKNSLALNNFMHTFVRATVHMELLFPPRRPEAQKGAEKFSILRFSFEKCRKTGKTFHIENLTGLIANSQRSLPWCCQPLKRKLSGSTAKRNGKFCKLWKNVITC